MMDFDLLYFTKLSSPGEPLETGSYFTDIKYEEKSAVSMWKISVSNVALQYLLDIRDYIYSKNPNELNNCTKVGVVAILCLTAAVGYTVLNIAEASIRYVAGVIGTIVALPLACIASYWECPENGPIYMFFGRTALVSMFSGLLGGFQGTCQVGAGFFAAYQMITNRQPQSLPVGELVKIASCGIPNQLVDFVSP